MKLYYPLIGLTLLTFVSGCDKDDPAPAADTAGEIVKEEVTKTLATESDLTEFVAAFEELELNAEDVAEGITIFAPGNSSGNPGGRMSTSSRTTALTPEVLKGHIIKGLLNAQNLQDGDALTSIDGKPLMVTVEGDEIRVNGVLLTSRDLASTAKYVIHKVEEPLPYPITAEEPASIVVTVWNSLNWSPENPKGLPEVDVTVKFYTSRADYPHGTPAYTTQTDSEGKATFPDAEAGASYFILAQKSDLSNIFYSSPQPVDGIYSGFIPEGLFQTQEEIETYAFQSDAAIGNFRWQDLNMDSKIDNGDKAPIPYPEVKPIFSETLVDVIIGYGNNDLMTVRSAEDALNTLQQTRSLLNQFHKTLVMMDGILSDGSDDEYPGNPTWGTLDNFTFNAAHPMIFKIWNDGYNTLGQLNVLLRDVPALTFEQKEAVIAEAKGMRAYTYLQLATYFGDVPIMEGITLESEAARNTKDEVFNLAQTDLDAAADVLPGGPSANRDMLTADAAKLLLARLALYKKDYYTATALTDELLQNSDHSLAATTDEAFVDTSNDEIIWDFSFNLPTGFSEYFFGRTFCPALRFAEVYLIQAEALIEMNYLETARLSLDILRNRLAMPPSSATTPDEFRVELQETWHAEMSREGNRFANLVKWGTASELLGGNGYNPSIHTLLPIPLAVVDKHFNIHQNPGY